MFENFDINDLKEEDTEYLGTALVNILTEINDAEDLRNISTNKFGDFIVEVEIDKRIIPVHLYEGTIIKNKNTLRKIIILNNKELNN